MMSPATKAVIHCVLHTCCCAMILVMLMVIADLKANNLLAYRVVRQAEALVQEAAETCGRPAPKPSLQSYVCPHPVTCRPDKDGQVYAGVDASGECVCGREQ
jgi:hypothetical protein